MNRAIFAGVVVLAMSAAPAFAQSTRGQGTSQGTTSTSQGTASGTQGSTATHGQTGTNDTARKGDTSNKAMSNATADHHFIMDAAKGGLAEVDLGKLASEKASNDQVKQFGQRMVTDHGKANDELKTIAQKKNITLPTELDAKDKAVHDRLSKLSGEAFDRAYMQTMLRDHRKDVNEFKKESTAGKDPDVKQFASSTLPTLEEHLKLAQQTDRSVVGTSGTKGAHKAKGTSGTSSKGTSGSTSSNPNSSNPGRSR